LSERDDVIVYGPRDPERRGGVISFNFKNVRPEKLARALMSEGIMIHPHDVAQILDLEGIALRSGHHCAQPLMERLGVPATSRASFYIYNGKDDVDAFVDSLDNVRKVLKL